MHEYALAAIVIDQVLMLEQRVKVIQGHRYFLLSEALRGILDQLHAVRLGEIQHGALGTCIQNLLNIFLPSDISACNHGNPYHAVHPLHQVYRLVMLLVRIREVEDQQFVSPVVAVIFCKPDDVICHYRIVVEPFYRFAACNEYAGNQSFITHHLCRLLYRLPFVVHAS